ncbi:MAG: acetyl-CoA carboxylase, carboxyltransferase subunit beta [Candidatus Ratteibacteria bacterium]|nr:acetyl-CoA carboxylase, carboxyltransferase subunit beta [Candidatus Ratteibacteria bacterium]
MIFKKKRYANIEPKEAVDIKKDLWVKCDRCGKLIYKKKWEENLKVCPYCGHYGRMSSYERISLIADSGSFKEMWPDMFSEDPLGFIGVKAYKEKLEEEMKKTGLKEAIVAGECKIGGIPCMLAVIDANFIMGSMGSVVGEKFTLAAERSMETKYPFICVSGGGGGARMYEGVISLMQMAKTSAAAGKLKQAGLLYLSVLTDPTMGGIAASFAFLGDIIIAEPGALIGFAGPRVIEQTIRQKLPPDFQRTEFLFEHGMIDIIAKRAELKETISKILRVLYT